MDNCACAWERKFFKYSEGKAIYDWNQVVWCRAHMEEAKQEQAGADTSDSETMGVSNRQSGFSRLRRTHPEIVSEGFDAARRGEGDLPT